MKLEEAEAHGCPKELLEHLRQLEVTQIGYPEPVDWAVVKADIEEVFGGIHEKGVSPWNT